MRPMKKVLWAFALAMPFFILNATNAFAVGDDNDEDVSDVTARVARVSFISGDAQIKRADSDDWERVSQNLPLVEGDEIATDQNSRLEIQFDSQSYLRLSENSYLKITTLRDEGIAVSLPNGTLNARVLRFDKNASFFEIDAPQTTVSIEKSGMYRVDAGSRNDREIRVTVADSGLAQVYSANSGFTLKNGRSATIQIDGDYAGEFEIADASKFADEFDGWALQRDSIIAKRLQKADYDKYYDQDFYGAEDLNDYGEWIYTKKYGYVWRPFRDSVSSYADWSPYRYGSWRWLPAYGWTWVNDEPWGWATYHHGRWVYDDDYWYWTPYPQNRGRRSWWRPALVVINYIGSNICWYPLPYSYGYYNYNSYYVDRRRYKTTIVRNTTVNVYPNPTPTPQPVVTGRVLQSSGRLSPKLLVPANGVVTVDASNFGRGKGNFRLASNDLAKKALNDAPTETVKPLILPTIKDLNGKISREIQVENPEKIRVPTQIKTGATERTDGVPIGETLRKERIWGNRSPVVRNPSPVNGGETETQSPVRNTGAIKREPRLDSPQNSETPVRQSPENGSLRNTNRILRKENNDNNGSENETPIFIKPNRNQDNREITPRQERIEKPQPPRRERQEEPIRQQPPREEPRIQSPGRVEPKREQPRREEPVRQAPPRQEQPKQEPPPAKISEPGRGGKVNKDSD